MFMRLLFALALLSIIFVLMHKYRRLPTTERKQWVIKIVAFGLIGIVLLAVITGRMHWLGGVLATVAGFAKFGLRSAVRFFPLFKLFGKKAFGNPVFNTPFLKLQLDLKNNRVSGEVIDGPYKGTAIESLNDEQLAELESHYQKNDRRSWYLIRMLRQFSSRTASGNADTNSQHKNQNDYSSVSDPSLDEALQVLGFSAGTNIKDLDKKIVIQAHRRLMQKIHPDRGGNDYLASRVNIAKEIVLKHIA